jgi:hypothetical protein
MTPAERDRLIETFASELLQGHHYTRINQARSQAEAVLGVPIKAGDAWVKLVDEAMEAAIVRVAQAVVQDADTTHRTYDRLVELLAQQPNLAVRTSTSVMQQAYSTPIPIAYLAANLAQITPTTTVYEPTAGNGALLITANPALVTANELNPKRSLELQQRGFVQLTQENALTYHPPALVDRVIANPPFGTLLDQQGQSQKFPIYNTITTQIDQVIAFKALEAMKPDGCAVLILGGKLGKDMAERSTRYHSRESRAFFKQLYDRYNVIDHFSIWGGLYRKQGAGFPIDLIVIEGQGKSARKLPAAAVPEIYDSFEALKEKLPDVSLQRLSPTLGTDRTTGAIHFEGAARFDSIDAATIPRLDGIAGDVADPGLEREYVQRSSSRANHAERHDLSAPTNPGDTLTPTTSAGMAASVGDHTHPPDSRILRTSSHQSQFISTHAHGQDPSAISQPARHSQQHQPERLAHHPDQPIQPLGVIPMPDTTSYDLEPKQVDYLPRSQAPRIGTLIPINMATSAQQALDQFELQYGNIDDFLVDRLGYSSRTQLYQYFSAEQVDGAALAIANIEAEKGFVIGDQTGIGKGRICAAVMRYAQQQGLEAIFVSQNPSLYADIVRDVSDIGTRNFRPWMTDAGKSIPLPIGGMLRSGNAQQQEAAMQTMMAAGTTGYDAIFTTYNQLQTVSNGVEPARRAFLRSVAPRAIIILDEAHEAGGSQSEWKKSGPPNRADFVRELVDCSRGTFFSSATSIKRPDVIDLYARKTDLRHAVTDVSSLSQLLNDGGVPLQQMVASGMVKGGDMRRLERSYAGITFEAQVVPVNRAVVENLAAAMRAIQQFDEAKRSGVIALKEQAKEDAKAISEDNSIGQVGVSSVQFTSLMHNCISQTLVALKAEETVQVVLAQIHRQEKPVIALANTMGSFIGWYADEYDIQPGATVNLTFGDLLNRYLERSRDVLVKDYTGESTRRQLTNRELGAAGVEAFQAAKSLINESDFSSIPTSPIDYIKHRLSQAGYTVGEITGRDAVLRYEPDGTTTYQLRSTAEKNTSAKIETVRRFNAGEMDCIILNRSGATGISLHASASFVDQRPRHMNILQAAGDINEFVQMLGRVNRTGQVVPPQYSLIMSDIPAEKRPGAILMKKMASLNANTTAARESGLSLTTTVDFMNVYGEAVVASILADDYELDAALGSPYLKMAESELPRKPTELIEKVTGRIPLLPLVEQEKLYDQIESNYLSWLEGQRAIGANQLEAERLDFDAKTIAQMEYKAAINVQPGPFTGAVHIEIVDVKSSRKPLTQLQMVNQVRETLGLDAIDAISTTDREDLLQHGRSQATAQIQAWRDEVTNYESRVIANQSDPEKAEKFSERLTQQTRHVTDILRTYAPGSSVRVATPEPQRTLMYGVVESIERKHQSANPAAASDWRATILVADSAQQVVIPLSQFNTDREKGWSIDVIQSTITGVHPYELFDIHQSETRTQRQICTGNLIAAFSEFQGGHFVHFTTHTGEVRQGLLMSQDFDISMMLDKQPIDLRTSENVQAFLTDWTDYQGIVSTKDGQLRIQHSREGFSLSTPMSRERGRAYFLDPSLIAAVGNEFVSSNGQMNVTVPDERLADVLEVLMQQRQQAILTTNLHTLARDIMGIDLPMFTAVDPEQVSQSTIVDVESEIDLSTSDEVIQSAGLDAVVIEQTATLRQPQPIAVPIAEETFFQGQLFELVENVEATAVTEINKGQMILAIAARAYEFGQQQGKVQPEGTQWIYQGRQYDIGYDTSIEQFFVQNKIRTVEVYGAGHSLDLIHAQGISPEVITTFAHLDSILQAHGYIETRLPQATQALAQQQWQAPCTLQDLQTWHKQAKEIGRSQSHLKEITKIERSLPMTGGMLSDRARKVRDDDMQTWYKQLDTVVTQAQAVVQNTGIPIADGQMFQGNHYRIVETADTFSIEAMHRGKILHIQNGNLVNASINHHDAARFAAHTQLLTEPANSIDLER